MTQDILHVYGTLGKAGTEGDDSTSQVSTPVKSSIEDCKH